MGRRERENVACSCYSGQGQGRFPMALLPFDRKLETGAFLLPKIKRRLLTVHNVINRIVRIGRCCSKGLSVQQSFDIQPPGFLMRQAGLAFVGCRNEQRGGVKRAIHGASTVCTTCIISASTVCNILRNVVQRVSLYLNCRLVSLRTKNRIHSSQHPSIVVERQEEQATFCA